MKSALIGVIGLSVVTAGHFWHQARYERAVSGCADQKQALRDDHERHVARLRQAEHERVEQERDRRRRAAQEAEEHEQAKASAEHRASALQRRLDELEVAAAADCIVPADRVQLVREAARRGDGVRHGAAGPAAGEPDDGVPAAAGAGE